MPRAETLKRETDVPIMTTDTSCSKRLNPFTVAVLERGTMNNRSSEFIDRGNLIVNNFFFLSGKHWIKR